MVFDGLTAFISKNYSGKVVEVCCGNRFDVALELSKRGFNIVCVDVKRFEPPEGVSFECDDIRNPRIEIYENSSLIYSIRPPYELYKHIIRLSDRVMADCIIKPLYGEHPEGLELVNHLGDYFYLRQLKSFE
ncbi:Uncharacterized protein conserved in archaea [Archaeoglobus sulfaticallidus PM70-1]|uniref:UPF0146 protein Asulf_00066 n=1 Tax=Archaeoglobus sulfaticallidus PM70-1 TaxID=387631 RepID=N0BCZ5_9EURY|nr:UPF0146 family protein [Archaeoglobus sulfaticallidus]AGK60102.1 Uncharacterized protein conserved in archaea [Archaeoglobus sulfaticallidus PM70-1]